MLNAFTKNESGGVSPQFAILISAIFIGIGGGLYVEGDSVYRLFDSLMNEIKYAVKL